MGGGGDPAEPRGPLAVDCSMAMILRQFPARLWEACVRAAVSASASSRAMKFVEPRFFGNLHVVPTSSADCSMCAASSARRCSISARNLLSASCGIASTGAFRAAPASDCRFGDFAVAFGDFLIDPLRQRLIVHDHVDDRKHGGQVAAPQHGDHQRREQAAGHVDAMGKGDFQSAAEVLHACAERSLSLLAFVLVGIGRRGCSKSGRRIQERTAASGRVMSLDAASCSERLAAAATSNPALPRRPLAPRPI